jgi:5-methylcytosine-specific restriction endonuclease McrA
MKPMKELDRAGLRRKWINDLGEESLFCYRCGYDENIKCIHIHHVIYVCNGGTNDPSNLEPLCLNCHTDEHTKNGPDPEE